MHILSVLDIHMRNWLDAYGQQSTDAYPQSIQSRAQRLAEDMQSGVRQKEDAKIMRMVQPPRESENGQKRVFQIQLQDSSHLNTEYLWQKRMSGSQKPHQTLDQSLLRISFLHSAHVSISEVFFPLISLFFFKIICSVSFFNLICMFLFQRMCYILQDTNPLLLSKRKDSLSSVNFKRICLCLSGSDGSLYGETPKRGEGQIRTCFLSCK